jgi:ankyrin repeat protein
MVWRLGLTSGDSFQTDPACIREFLLRGADPNISAPNGETLLRTALRQGGEEDEWKPAVELLLEHGAKLEPEMLFVAPLRASKLPELRTKFLLDKGLDPNYISAEYGTPLHQAVESARGAVVKLLLDTGADPTIRAPATARYPGLTPAEIATSKLQSGTLPDGMQDMLDILQSSESVAR